MKPSITGQVQTDLKLSQEAETKTRTYKTPCGEPFTITEDEFSKVVEILDYLRKSRDSKNTQVDTLEPESGANTDDSSIEEKVG